MSFTIGEALIAGFLYYLAQSELYHFPLDAHGILMDPVCISFAIGLFYGDVPTALTIGAAIGIMYISTVAVGANLPADKSLATCIGVPIALKYGLSPEEAIVIAVPFAVLGAMIDNARRVFGSLYYRMAKNHIDNRNYNLSLEGVIIPQCLFVLIRLVPVFLLLYFLGDQAGTLITSLPKWISTGLSTIGGVLPAVGLMMCVTLLGGLELLPFFLIGYYLFKVFGFSMLSCGLVGLAFAAIYATVMANRYEDDGAAESGVIKREGLLSKKDVLSFCCRHFWVFRMSQSMEQFFAVGTCNAMIPSLKKIYKDDPDGLQVAVQRHLTPFITNPTTGSWLLSSALALEEDIAENGDANGEKGKAITALKTSLMGPMAGIGDTLLGGTLRPMINAVFYSFAAQGSVLGIFGPILYSIFNCILYYVLTFYGYIYGKAKILSIITGNAFKKIMIGAGALGVTMMGSLAAQNVKLATAISFTSQDENVAISLQSKLDGLLPNLLPLLACAGVYAALKKGVKPSRIMLVIVIAGLLGALIGIF